MNRPKPKNKAAAYQQLIKEYEKVTGKKANHTIIMICEISAERAMTQEWSWEKNDNPKWGIQLNWK